ncbi:Phosphopantothenoylcysteine decarboxylase / Phosphopantothenoylcysteine synthetase [Paramagnetospirillum magnetotacticum MS-1]|uniref:Coenzyme A biosynthesis bifunctional protein CoaBC n=1 Tax=Paramagnetospirillum magnetotacticum MS-1 TaxID=272627 RepID=A0A0C2YEE1_PARME|nr:bifunctional phosphopantothenoylcysteine decarboxylase/phosphopantothenate--cysteine ligase CoaBC [Paramagnetospirillum magnetotacticum]KIL98069.1 Phosphopantothenoylcysteine decarboxylase / Phosphopantothenoylcysteine synthetase [Paramagnetospirillum magnetotacticum MS-1]
MLDGRRVLLIISGGIAAYKSLELIRRLKDRGCSVRSILTKGGANFVTPLSVAALSGDKVYQETFSLTDEAEMGHIRLSREADLVVVAPATANLLAKMAAGIADDLASTALLATDKPVLVAPAMNTMMWEHPATRANMATLEARGVTRIGPGAGDLACGEVGAGRMAEPAEILAAIESQLSDGPLKGVKAIVTSGPTREAIDPVRFIANRSSGKQGHAIASALAALGAEVTLVSGPVSIPDPTGLAVVKVESAVQMLNAVRSRLPAHVVVCAAAVADWTVANRATEKRKKKVGDPPPTIELTPNPDILMTVSKAEGPLRPTLVVGFAAETEKLMEHAADKLARKGCDWIVANDVSEGTGTFGGDANTVHVLDSDGVESWPAMGKEEVARKLAERIAKALGKA